MQAVVLAGGFGTRLSHVVKDVPKPMAPISGKPFLLYLYEQLKKNGYDRFIFLTGYKSEIVEEYFKDFKDVQFLKETSPLGTGGALLNAYSLNLLEEKFLLVNGDTFFNADIKLLSTYHKKDTITIGLRFSTDISRYGFVTIDDSNSNELDKNLKFGYKVLNFLEKGSLPPNQIDGYINSGSYMISRTVLEQFMEQFNGNLISLENDILPKLINDNFVYALPLGGDFIDIGIPDDYYRAQTFIPKSFDSVKKPALFIDKDGTIIRDTGYTHGVNIEIIQSTLEYVKSLCADKNYHLIMITNQAGIAKDKFSEEDMNANIQSVCDYYKKQGLEFDDIEYCVYHPDAKLEKYKYKSLRRKPYPGMILQACEKLDIDLENSMMLGDNPEVDNIKLPYLKSVIILNK
ncbi:MAG: HAD-IIIA family hydrolase [Succinivibrionaceae bacterium]